MTATDVFCAFVRARAIRVGYDLSSARSGGRKQLADDTGMSHASVCRMLNGQTVPVAEVLESLASALDVHVGLLLELAGVVSPGVLTRDVDADPKPLTVQQAAFRLGITEPVRISVFEALTEALLKEATP